MSNYNRHGQICLAWYQTLEERRGDRNRLRRATEPQDVTDIPSYHALRVQLQAAGYDLQSIGPIKVCAAALAHIRAHRPGGSLATAMARAQVTSKGDAKRVSDRAFRQLVSADSAEDLFRPLIRMLRMHRDGVDVANLAGAILYWGAKNRERWQEDYYGYLAGDRRGAQIEDPQA